MSKFFVTPDQVADSFITIKGSDVHHISKVLRLKSGDRIFVSDGTGREYLAELTEFSSQKVMAHIKDSFPSGNEPAINVSLLQGLSKGEKMELIIQKCTEIGVRTVVPVNMERTVVRFTGQKAIDRRERWQRIAYEAAKQCHRGIVPEVKPICDLRQALQGLPDQTILVMPWEEEKRTGLREILKQRFAPDCSLALLIGPEGGISPQEAAIAAEYGARKVSLGPRILRTETAGLVALTLVLYELGDIGGNSFG